MTFLASDSGISGVPRPVNHESSHMICTKKLDQMNLVYRRPPSRGAVGVPSLLCRLAVQQQRSEKRAAISEKMTHFLRARREHVKYHSSFVASCNLMQSQNVTFLHADLGSVSIAFSQFTSTDEQNGRAARHPGAAFRGFKLVWSSTA